MVFPDLSAPEAQPRKSKNPALAIASMSDRFLAFILDFLIFSPIVSLFIASMVRQTKTFFLLNPTSQEGAIAAGLVAAMIVFFVTLLQAVFLYYWQATPGQFFLQLRVVSFPHPQERLSLNQCLLRAFFWCTGFLCLAVPFLEIASHPFRRAFHERASDTMVMTLKQQGDEGPHPLESRFISSWMRMSFLFLLLFGVLGFFKTYHMLKLGAFREKDGHMLACKEIKDPDLSGVARVDAALSLFLLNEVSAECLEKEAEASLWNDPVNSQDMAYLAKFVISEGEEQQKYFAKVCRDSTSSPCAIARYMQEQGTAEDLIQADASLWTTQLLLSDEKFTQRDYMKSLQMIEALQKVPSLKNALEKRYVRAMWALNESSLQPQGSGRAPASVSLEEKDSWVEKFKERYEVP